MSDKKLEQIENKIDKLSDRLGSIDVTLAKQHESLKDHIRRTEILEDAIDPIQKHVLMVNSMTKIIGAVILAIGALEGIFAILTYLRK